MSSFTTPPRRIDLTRFDDDYERLKPGEDRTMTDLPDGEYRAVIDEVALVESPMTFTPLLVWTMSLFGPEGMSAPVRRSVPISERTLSWIKEDLEKCGVRIKKLSELPAHLEELGGREVGVAKRTRDGRTNFYLRWPERRAAAASGETTF